MVSGTTQLYFLAIIPPSPLREEIQQIKLYFKEHYDSEHALKAPPHITLLNPFRVATLNAKKLDRLLKSFCSQQDPLLIHLCDYAVFPPRVIFINVEQNDKLMNCQVKIEQLAKAHPEVFIYYNGERTFYPHLSLAFKDLAKAQFHKAWAEFEAKSFRVNFVGQSLFLLKHDGEQWQIEEEYLFKGAPLAT